MIKHFCNGCQEETATGELTPVSVEWKQAVTQASGFVQLASAHNVTADLCPACRDYLARFLASDGEIGRDARTLTAIGGGNA